MATKIKRTLFVGLGGTGMMALLYTKKLFIDTYGEVPPMIGFLGIDTDNASYNKSLPGKYGEVRLDPFEQVRITEANPKSIYLKNKDKLSWIPEQNAEALTKLTDGAGQVRTNGRFAFSMNYASVAAKVNQSLNNISHASIARNNKFELMDTGIEINMIFSIAGGTGCGTFIDVAYMLKNVQEQQARRGKLVGYAVLPDVFDAQLSFDKDLIKPNAYGALLDLDYLMHLGVGDKIDLDYLTTTGLQADGAPFNAVFFASNRNNNGDTYDNVDQLAEMISLALVTGAGELSDAAASVADNAEKKMIAHVYDICNKRAWASGLGISEIVFHSNDLSAIYKAKLARAIIEKLRNNGNDAEIIANNWANEAKVLETNGRDDVIDRLLSRMPQFPLSDINDHSNPKQEVDIYKQRVAAPAAEIDKVLEDKKREVEASLYQLMVDTSNGKFGIGLSREVLKSIQREIDKALIEMRKELEDFQRLIPGLESSLESSINELKSENSKFFKFGRREKEAVEDVCEGTNKLVIATREIQRREGALVFFNWLTELVRRGMNKIEEIDQMLARLHDEYGAELAAIDDRLRRQSKTFVIDLSLPYINRVTIEPNEIDVPGYVKTLPWTDGVYEFHSKPTKSIKESLDKFTAEANGARLWSNRDVEGALRELSESERREVFKLAIQQSSPLLPVDFRGFVHQTIPDYFYIGVPDKNNTILRDSDIDFESLLSGDSKPDFSSIGGSERIIIYRQFGVVPPYAITSTAEYKRAYDAWTKREYSFTNHFDENLRLRMVREKFSLSPTDTADTDAMEIWVKGLIFGLIKKENDMFYYIDRVNGDPLDDYWTELSKYRDEAFNKLRSHIDDIADTYEQHIQNLRTLHGEEKFIEKVNDAKVNYREKYSANTLSNLELKDRANKGIADQLRRELKYVEENL